MNRRDFIKKVVLLGSAVTIGASFSDYDAVAECVASDFLSNVQIIDAHAHPDMNYRYWGGASSGYRYMREAKMAASVYSAIGDYVHRHPKVTYSEYEYTKRQLNWWINGVVSDNNVCLVRNVSDIPEGGNVPGAILAIEGGDALEGNLQRVEEFYNMGVRVITLVHFCNNEIGDIMKEQKGIDPGPYNGGLTAFGHSVIAKMEALGMIIDVAHAHLSTYKDILSVATKPVIDSHTNLCSNTGIAVGRMRTLKEMELVAMTGGVVCTWPQRRQELSRTTVEDWAKEILIIKNYLGIEHVGLGTDGGGIKNMVEGYKDVRDLGVLAEAMLNVGLSKDDVAAYMGGNLMRVLKNCLG